ncbi:hypothetical protein [Natrarchaeobaculum aegyptiacum]|uniref:Uncharacterized protein n=1 Tax=Natrarchaeobaculum aegyptiacum TaxID=745377 RepID=A0A2Z2HT70_9EURY|nr:hypothetical protein [Natrarchaeobaculum aegyptiacum]ARS90416.1 hypothetical protein B1756_12205 [Natrarchaeobaculum aegyptiacum]
MLDAVDASTLAVVFAVLVGATALVGYRRLQTRAQRALAADLESRLAAEIRTGIASHLERPPRVRTIRRVDEARNEEPAVVPVVRVDLETADTPGTELACEYVADVLRAVHPACRERAISVQRYELEFGVGPGGLLVGGECRRIDVPPALADRVVDEGEYRAFDLHRDLKRRSLDEDSTAVLWVPC